MPNGQKYENWLKSLGRGPSTAAAERRAREYLWRELRSRLEGERTNSGAK